MNKNNKTITKLKNRMKIKKTFLKKKLKKKRKKTFLKNIKNLTKNSPLCCSRAKVCQC